MGKLCGLVLLLIVAIANCQENAGTNVAEALIECYNNTEFKERDRRLPTTINVLIDLIRRVEDGKSTQDARSFAIELIHRFRQDGITKVRDDDDVNILPFSPKGYQIYKTGLLLETFIPGSAVNFPNETLNSLQKCSLHYMLSNTFELNKRVDEASVCNKLGKYTMRRIKRDQVAKITDDFETFSTSSKGKRSNDVVEGDGSRDVEQVIPRQIPKGYTPQTEISDCPVESGVIYTKYGAVHGGTVVGAIAASFVSQKIENNGKIIDSYFASTLAGDIAETALIQGTRTKSFNVGLKGYWKTSTVPRWYLIAEKTGYEMTEAEIRGDLDGLIIAKNMDAWRNKYSNIKVSQILDMYYSHRGVFDSKIRACDRNKKITEYATNNEIVSQSTSFAYMYNKKATFEGTIKTDAIEGFVQNATNNYLNYYPKLADTDLKCDVEDKVQRIATEIYIVLDLSWSYDVIYPAISYLLDNLDVNKYQSNYTIINAQNGSVLVNSSSIIEFHERYNRSVHDEGPSGFKVIEPMKTIQTLLERKAELDKAKPNVGGKSNIVLMVPNQAASSEDGNFIYNKRQSVFGQYFPDVKFMVLGSGNKESHSNLASNDDIFILNNINSDSNIMQAVDPLIRRIAEVPRRIANPRCGPTMNGDLSANYIELDVEPGTINYYKVSPNYLHGEGTKNLKIRGQWGTMNVCISRSDAQPSLNKTGPSSCKSISGSEETFDLTDTCVDELSSCQPFYFSIEANPTSNTIRCTDCRFPDSLKFTVTIDGFTCKSSSSQLFGSFMLIALMLYILKL